VIGYGAVDPTRAEEGMAALADAFRAVVGN
jgi:hypothetical protein